MQNNSLLLLGRFFVILGILCIVYYFLFFNQYDRYTTFYDPKLEELRQRLIPSIPEFKNIAMSGSNQSFTLNKRDVHICTKDELGRYYEDNMLIYVMLHELAHVLCNEVGHTEKYRSIFTELLNRAEKAGVYDSSTPPLDNYCNY